MPDIEPTETMFVYPFLYFSKSNWHYTLSLLASNFTERL